MSATQEDIANMNLLEAVHYLKTKIHVHEIGIKWCKKMLDEYGDIR